MTTVAPKNKEFSTCLHGTLGMRFQMEIEKQDSAIEFVLLGK